MKKYIVLLVLIMASFAVMAQSKVKKDSLHKEIILTPYQKQKIEEFKKTSEEFNKLNQDYQKWLFELVDSHYIDVNRINGDSIKILADKITIVLKPKK
jgi:uncharacterized membrane-anchored protein YhcB (DUF1043 family)